MVKNLSYKLVALLLISTLALSSCSPETSGTELENQASAENKQTGVLELPATAALALLIIFGAVYVDEAHGFRLVSRSRNAFINTFVDLANKSAIKVNSWWDWFSVKLNVTSTQAWDAINQVNMEDSHSEEMAKSINERLEECFDLENAPVHDAECQYPDELCMGVTTRSEDSPLKWCKCTFHYKWNCNENYKLIGLGYKAFEGVRRLYNWFL